MIKKNLLAVLLVLGMLSTLFCAKNFLLPRMADRHTEQTASIEQICCQAGHSNESIQSVKGTPVEWPVTVALFVLAAFVITRAFKGFSASAPQTVLLRRFTRGIVQRE